MHRTGQGTKPLGSIHRGRFCDRILMPWRAVTTEKGAEPAQTYGSPVPGTDLLSQSLRKQAKAATTHQRKVQTLGKRRSARSICTWSQTLKLKENVNPAGKSNELIFLRPFLRSSAKENPIVREHFPPRLYLGI